VRFRAACRSAGTGKKRQISGIHALHVATVFSSPTTSLFQQTSSHLYGKVYILVVIFWHIVTRLNKTPILFSFSKSAVL
jgi:hypothetical protein